MDMQEVKGILEMIEDGAAILPEIKKVLDKFTPFIGELIGELSSFQRRLNVENIQYYMDKGMTRQEALLLVINSNAALSTAIQNICATNKINRGK